MKTCSKCKIEKNESEFSKYKSSKNGLQLYCKGCMKDYYKDYYKDNKQAITECQKEYKKNNKQAIAEYQKNRLSSDPAFKFARNLRRRINHALKGHSKSASTQALTGCTWDFLRGWIESKFTPEMTWDNYGSLWHLDHVIPLSAFILSNAEAQLKACHYSNLQPLLAKDNIKKLDTLPDTKHIYLYMCQEIL